MRRRKETQLAIMILNYNGWRDTLNCIRNIVAIRQFNYPLLIIDNGSKDDSIEKLNSFFMTELNLSKRESGKFYFNNFKIDVIIFHGKIEIFFIKVKRNLGGSGGRNVGIKWILENLDVRYVFFLDNDALLKSLTISECLSISKRKKADLVGCLIKNMDGSLQFSGLNFHWNIFYLDFIVPENIKKGFAVQKKIDLLSSCGMLASCDLLSAIEERRGYFFDDRLFHWAEDQDLCLMTKKLGRNILLSEKAVVYHKISQGSAGLPLAYYYSTRNRIFLAHKYLKIYYRFLFDLYYPIFRLIRVYWDLLQGKKDLAVSQLNGLVDGYRGNGGKIDK